MWDRCELVCRWICSKECVLLCLELAGPPREAELPDPIEFAQVVARISADEEQVERLAAAVIDRDPAGFNAFITELKIERFRHVLCHWACTIRCRLLCRVVCSTQRLPHLDYVQELIEAGSTIGKLAENKAIFERALAASAAVDCERLRGVLTEGFFAERCHLVCEWFCTWRCVRVCFILCRHFPVDLEPAPLSEAFEFAKTTARLARQPDAVARLLDALDSEDVDLFGKVVNELELGRFCVQLCHWLCDLRCHRYCHCVCRQVLQPWFTHVGHFDIYGDIDSGTGLTNKPLSYSGLYHNGGPGFGFYDCLELRGFCPAESPTHPGVAMRYRFLYQLAGTPVPVTGSLLCAVDAGSRIISWPQNLGGIAGSTNVSTFQTITIAGAGVPDAIPPTAGSPWFGPGSHILTPDAQGWIAVDPAAIGGGFQTLIGLNTNQVVIGGAPTPGVAAGAAVPIATQRNGTNLAIIFEATRLPAPTMPPDYTNSLAKIHVNNWTEVNLLDIAQFHSAGGTACSAISSALDVEYTADHELMATWSLTITSNSGSAPASQIEGGATPRGGAGTHSEATTGWKSCSYVVTLATRSATTSGLIDNQADSQQVTFCID